jgi:hypothetical protein
MSAALALLPALVCGEDKVSGSVMRAVESGGITMAAVEEALEYTPGCERLSEGLLYAKG